MNQPGACAAAIVRVGRLALVSAIALMAMAASTPVASVAQAPAGGRIKVLFLGDDGHHQPNPRAKSILPVLAERGIDMFYTDDPSDLNPDKLRQYHVVMAYNNHGDITPAQLQSLLGFVRNGGGFVPIHSASAAFQNSPEYIALVGASFSRHGTDTFSTVHVEPNHPAIAGVPAFESWDETYVHSNHNPQGRTVLAVRRENGVDEPWTWVRTEGNGRVFYTAWGHDERTWTNPGFQDLIERGIRWAAGDWALSQPRPTPPPTMPLSAPLPNYLPQVPGQPRMGSPFTEAQVALSAEQALEMLVVPPGFKVENFAAEPMVYKPIDFTWDERGRMWVVETIDYPNILREEGEPGLDRVVILEDTNNDGRADKRTVFADGLNLATSLMFINGGVVVAQAPHMYFYQDRDGDDVADVVQILNTGWPRRDPGDTHGTPSNLRYGFDNRIWGAVGYNGYAGTSNGVTYDRNTFYAGAFSFDRNGDDINYIGRTSNNTWGLGFTEDNFVFLSTANNRPASFVHIPGDYYRAIGLPTPVTLPNIADRNDYYPVRGVMQVDQFGRYTAGSGFEVYTARAFPREFWNKAAFITEPTGHLVGLFELEPNGTAFVARNRWNMVASRDAWSAPVQSKVGPDGALWIADFYSLVAQHNPTPQGWVEGEGGAYETPYRDKEHGRIYRVVHEGAPATPPMRLDNATPAQLVAALTNDNLFWRQTAQRLLVDRGQLDVVPALIALVDNQEVDELGLNVGALHALWTLHGLGALDVYPPAMEAARRALRHPAASLRRAALQMLPRDQQLATGILTGGLEQDPDLQVRLAAILTLSELPASPQAGAWLNRVLQDRRNVEDAWIPDAVAIAALKQTPSFVMDVLSRPLASTDSAYVDGIGRMVTLATRSYAVQGPAQTGPVVDFIAMVPRVDPVIGMAILNGVLQGNNGWPANQPPTLTAAQREALSAAARGASEQMTARFTAIAQRWGMPELFQ
jgi:putative membrane-bound dehydrogenase-like protein